MGVCSLSAPTSPSSSFTLVVSQRPCGWTLLRKLSHQPQPPKYSPAFTPKQSRRSSRCPGEATSLIQSTVRTCFLTPPSSLGAFEMEKTSPYPKHPPRASPFFSDLRTRSKRQQRQHLNFFILLQIGNRSQSWGMFFRSLVWSSGLSTPQY